MSRYIAPYIRRWVEERAEGCCEYCFSQQFFSPDVFAIDHILPVSKGGSNELDNLAFSCQGCNRRKYIYTEAKDPKTGRMAPLYHPRQHRWKDHFYWSKSWYRIKADSPIGRATLAKLELNRKGVRNLRKVLTDTGDHPPSLITTLLSPKP